MTSIQPSNRILINSLPKSGTHLLTQAIEIFGYQEYATHLSYLKKMMNFWGLGPPRFLSYGAAKTALKKTMTSGSHPPDIRVGPFTSYYVNQPTIHYWLNSIPPGQYIQGHLPWSEALVPMLTGLNYRHLVIIRDPRAVIASFIPFVLNAYQTDMGPHFLEQDFKSMSFRQQLEFVLTGGYAPKAGVEVRPFTEVFRAVLAWRNQPGCLFLRFEELVGPQGGGSLEQQVAVVRNIAAHLQVPFDEQIAARIKEIYNPAARTFRIGKIDGWKQTIAADDLVRLNHYCEELCQEAGYF